MKVNKEYLTQLKKEAKIRFQEREKAFLSGTDDFNLKYHYNSIPYLYRKMWLECYQNASTPKRSIKIKCLQCKSFTRNEVKNCADDHCAIWHMRPYQDKASKC